MREFDFDNIGKRMPYSLPEGFIEEAKSRAKAASMSPKSSTKMPIVARLAIAASVVVAVCGAAMWLGDFYSPEKRYDRLLANLSSDVLWEFACEYDVDADIAAENFEIETDY